VEFLLEEGCLLLAVRNIGAAPAMRVRVRLEPAIRDLTGRVEIGELALLRRLEFLGPGREIRALVDSLASYRPVDRGPNHSTTRRQRGPWAREHGNRGGRLA
jgi:hypothetical protein